MLALGIDTGIATAGWALAARSGRVVACGVIVLPRDKTQGARADLVARATQQAARLTVQLERATCVVCEAVSWGMPGANARAMTAMSVGIVLGLAAAAQKPVHFVPPKTWQDLVAPRRKKGDYAAVSAAIFTHLQRSGLGATVAAIKTADRNHAFDATALAVYGALHHLA